MCKISFISKNGKRKLKKKDQVIEKVMRIHEKFATNFWSKQQRKLIL